MLSRFRSRSSDFDINLTANTRLRCIHLQASGYGNATFADWALTLLRSSTSHRLEEVTLDWPFCADNDSDPEEDRAVCVKIDEELARHAASLRHVAVTYEATRSETEWGLLQGSFPQCSALGVLHVEEIVHEDNEAPPKKLATRL